MGKKIDYRVRTAKYIERRMLLDVFRKFNVFNNIEDYRYIGMGSIYFTDFILFHKYLNISNMISLEKNEKEKERYLFNKPYHFIDVLFGLSSEIIEFAIDDNNNNIIWLDYDSFFEAKEVLGSIKKIIPKVKSGTFMAFSFNIQRNIEEQSEIEKFQTSISSYVNLETKKADFSNLNYPKTIQKVLNNYIEKKLNTLNASINDVNEKLEYKPLIFMKYKDSVDMLTVGGIFVKSCDNEKYESMNLKRDLDFVSFDDNVYCIDVPILTTKEIQLIDSEMIETSGKLKKILKEKIEKYKKIYRYYPHYVDSNIM